MSTASEELLLAANQSFFDAFENLDFEGMKSVWLHSEAIRLVHPGWRAISGWSGVMESWRAIFSSSVNMQFILTETELHTEGDIGIVTCIANIVAGTGESEQFGAIQATCVFVLRDGKWQLMVHHGSPVVHITPSE